MAIGVSDLFRSISAKLKDSISSDLIAVSASLYAKSLITIQLHQEMTEGLDSNSNKAAKLIDVLQDSLDTHTNPEAYLQEVCSALKDVGEKQIVDLVDELELSISMVQPNDSSSASVPIDEPEDTPSAADRMQGKIEKWLEEGKVELKVTRINMHGAPGAGKTYSQHLLLNEPPPDKITDSTSIACRAAKATRISVDDENKKWERVDIEDLLNQLASHLEEALTSTDDVPDHLDELSLEEPTKKKPTDMKVIKQIAHALETGNAKKLSRNWVYFIDSGGQPAYRELLPLFTRAAALNIITIDLTKGLDEKCEFQYRISEHTSPINTNLQYSNHGIIQSTISSEAMLNPVKIPYVSDMPKHSHYLMLGTRIDELEKRDKLDELNKMNELLLKEYKDNRKVIMLNERQGSIIFPVNTLLPAGSKEREEASVELCTAISNFGVAMTIQLPIRLFAFEIALQLEAEKKKQSFLTREEVIETGKSLRLDKESDIDEALQYLHDVTIFLYYPAVLPNIIFVDPKPILDVFSRLIAITYVDHDKLHLIANPFSSADERNNLIHFGLFGKGLLKKIGKQICNKDFKPSHMIKLLKYLHIIAKVENREEGDYFFPCALPSYDKLNPPPTEIKPLLIAWEIKNGGTTTLAIPQGLFPLTIVHLLEQKDKVGFSPAGKEFYRCHDAMSLNVYAENEINTIDIINHFTHIEIRFDGHKDSCPLILNLVTEAIKKSSKNLEVWNNHIFAFQCPYNAKCFCIVQEDKSYTRCTQCQLNHSVLQGDDDSYRCWFSDSQLCSSEKIKNLLKEGHVELEITRINMHGAPGAGKTCSQHLLLNEDPPKNNNSTPIACPAVQATRISIDDKNKKLERVKIEDLLKQLAPHLEETLDVVPDRSDESSPKEPLEKKPTDMEILTKEIINAIQVAHPKFSTNWVYFIDSGGQPACRELLPLFRRAAALNIITIDLTKGLDEKFEFHYRTSEHTSPINTNLRYSNRDIIRLTISSKAMLNPIKIPFVTEGPKHSHYLILGTRVDDKSVTEEKLKEMNESLREYIANDEVIKQNERKGSIIFPVNTLLPAGSKEREDASVELYTAISNCSVAMTITSPIRFFTFEIALQMEAKEKERSFLTKEEVIKIGKSLRLDDESVIDVALQYLHNVTIILYYHEVLPNIIFVNPKQIFDVLSNLIAMKHVYIEHNKLHSIADPRSLRSRQDNLVKFGLFNKGLLSIIGKHIFNDDFQPSHMIKLLKHLNIITRIKNKKEGKFFFSCALPSCDKLNPAPTEIRPLLIAWEIKNDDTTTLAIPQGLFPLTIVHLLKRKDNEVEFAPDPDPDKPETEFYRCHDAMSLLVSKEHLVHIINRYTHLEIRLAGRKESCSLVLELVTDAIKRSSKNLNVAYDHVFAFKCPKNEQCYCIVQKNKSSTRCTQCRSQYDVLQQGDDSYGCWFISRKIEKWLEEGEVELKITRINMHGAPGAGKTCSQHLLLNEPPPDKLTDSTSIACPAVKATRISIDDDDENKKWKRVEEQDLYDQLAFHLKDKTKHQEVSTEDIEAPMSEDDDDTDTDTDSSDESLIEESPTIEPHTNEPGKNERPAESEQIATKNISVENELTEKKPIETEVIQNIQKTENAKKFSENWVYFIDSGGQPAYRELLPLFTRAAALNIITIDLTKGLDEKFEFHYRISQNAFLIKTKLQYSNLDVIHSTISSEAMFNPIKIPFSKSDKPKPPHYLILGTRKELVTEKRLKAMNESLTSSSNLDLKNVIQNELGELIIFPVNTLLHAGSKEREEASVELCKAISNCNLEITITLPIRLFTFEISLQREARKKKRSFLTKDEVKEIGKSLRLDKESDIDEALQYLHNVTIILYYHDVLPNIIFVDPEPILDVLSRLIAITYVDQSKLHLIASKAFDDERKRLKNRGLFKKNLLEKIDQQKIFNQNFESSHMINLLKHLHIIAEVKNKDDHLHGITDVENKEEKNEYFFPCALSSCKKFNDPPTGIQPLLIAWEIDDSDETTLAIPQGLFPLTIVHLLEQKDKVGFSPDPKSNNEFYRYHDAISLRVYKDHFIHVINRYTHIEIQFRGNCKGSCQRIRELVTEAITRSCKDLNCKDDHIFAFLKCPKKERYCIVRQDDKSSTWCSHCTHCETQCKALENDDSYSCWFLSSSGADASEGPPAKRRTVHHTELLDTSNLIDVLDVLGDHGYSGVDYYKLGLRLGLLPATLDVIKENNKGDVEGCLTKCLTAWLQQKDNVMRRGGPTYDTLIKALRKMGENAVADGIDRDKMKNKMVSLEETL